MSENQPPASLLSASQRKLVGFALSLVAVAVIILVLCAGVLALGRLLSHFSSVLWPLIVSGIMALILRPCVDYFEHRLKLRRLSAVLLLYGLFLLLCAGLMIALIPPLITQVLDLIAYVPTLWHNASEYVSRHYPDWVAFAKRQYQNPEVQKAVSSLLSQAEGLLAHALPSLQAAGGGLLSAFGFVAQLAIVPIYLFVFLLSRDQPADKLAAHLSFLKPELRDDVVFLVREFVNIVVSFFRGQFLVGLIMGCMLALGFSLVGLKFGLFLGIALGLLNIIPYLGSIIGLFITIPLAFFQPGGGWHLVALVLLVQIVVQNIEGWVITPKIMGKRTGLHPVVIIFALFFWGVALDGFLGMVLAIPLTAFFVTAWRLAKRRYWA
jgi:predicted PurR-regulated permease PerM